MTPVDQTEMMIEGKGRNGNCFQAVLASIFDVDLEDVPHFYDGHDAQCDVDAAHATMDSWMEDRGLALLTFPTGDWVAEIPGCILASGKSPRGEWNHIVVWERGRLAHDPNPARTGLDGEPITVDLIVLVDGAKFLAWKDSMSRKERES